MPGVSLTTSSLSKRYGAAEALRLDDLAIRPGERVGLVGNNGAGKTTFLRLALDIERLRKYPALQGALKRGAVIIHVGDQHRQIRLGLLR